MRYEEVLTSRYGLAVDRLEKTPGGWSADAYRVRAGAETYFLKVYDGSRPSIVPWIRRMDGYIPAVAWLQEQSGIGAHMPRLLPALDGARQVRQGDEVFLLFSFLEGVVPGADPLGEGQSRALGHILAALHSLDVNALPFAQEPLKEDLSLCFCDELKAALAAPDHLPDRLRALLSPLSSHLIQATDAALSLRDRARLDCQSLSLCHTDAHNGNLLQGADRLYLLDWEGLCLAPPEADLFYFCDYPHFNALLAAYQAERKGFCPDRQLLYFYAFRRKIEDIWAFIARLLEGGLNWEAEEFSYFHLTRGARGARTLLDQCARGDLFPSA